MWPINCQKLYGPFLWTGFNFLKQGYSHFEEAVYLPLSSQKFLVLILSTSEGWKVDQLTLEPPSASGFEHGTPGFGIQPLNHLAIAPCQAFVYNLPELS